MNELENFLKQSNWWQALDAAQQSRVLQDTVTRDFSSNAVVCQRGEPVTAWIGVVDGLVKLCNTDVTGKTVGLAGVPAGSWFGEGSLLKDENRKFQSIALRDSRIAFVPRDTFLWLLDTSISFNRHLLVQVNERLGQFIGALEHQRLLQPEGRLARCVAQMYNDVLYPRLDPTLSFSQAELGAITGLSRQRTNQALRTLEQAGLLRVEYGRVTVESLAGLRRYPEPLPDA